MITNSTIEAFRETSRVLIRNVDFMYLLPHPSLRNWISNYTITFPCAGMMSDDYAVIPHGSATLVIAFDGVQISGSLFGPCTKPACVGYQANRFDWLFIVEFQPAGYYAFSGMPQKELTDCVLPFDAVNPAMNRMVIHSGGRVSVKELSQRVFYSEQHLNRIFDEYMGVNVKSFSRLVRVGKAIRLLRHRNYSLTQIYLETGFYDMPHFIHDFKTICGVTPQEYRDNMSDFYSEIAKF